MPTYLYSCDECKKEFEAFHSIKEELNECPHCREEGKDSDPPKKLISKSTFVLLGGGWAKDQYR